MRKFEKWRKKFEKKLKMEKNDKNAEYKSKIFFSIFPKNYMKIYLLFHQNYLINFQKKLKKEKIGQNERSGEERN